jgi:hypothetical protein
MRRTTATVVISFAWLLALASPASAHTVAGVGATNFETRLLSVRPAVPGLTMRVVDVGSRFELRNTSGQDAVVLGYQGEPYLRVGPEGVFENQRSPATYLNASRKGNTPIPGSADPAAPPDWRRVSGSNTARWHDHRTHWMGAQDPPAVRRAPDEVHVVTPKWEVPVTYGGTTIVASGDLRWVPGPSPLPYYLLAAALFVLAALAARLRQWRAVLAALLAVLLVVDGLHWVGLGLAITGGLATKIGGALGGGVFSLLAWGVGIAGIVLLLRRRPDGPLAALLAGLLVAIFGGLIDLSVLSRSQIPFHFGAGPGRVVVATSLGLGLGVAASSLLALRWDKTGVAPQGTDSDVPLASASDSTNG